MLGEPSAQGPGDGPGIIPVADRGQGGKYLFVGPAPRNQSSRSLQTTESEGPRIANSARMPLANSVIGHRAERVATKALGAKGGPLTGFVIFSGARTPAQKPAVRGLTVPQAQRTRGHSEVGQ